MQPLHSDSTTHHPRRRWRRTRQQTDRQETDRVWSGELFLLVHDHVAVTRMRSFPRASGEIGRLNLNRIGSSSQSVKALQRSDAGREDNQPSRWAPLTRKHNTYSRI